MLVRRRPLTLDSSRYSREWDVERSTGCHLMQVINYVGRVTGEIKSKELPIADLEKFSLAGFLWEHVMDESERLEVAMSNEAMKMELIMRAPHMLHPGELFWCYQCDEVMQGGHIGQEHALSRNHTGIYFTIDGYDTAVDRVAEFKFTWMSSGKTGDDRLDIWKWIEQNKFYVSGMGGHSAGVNGGLFKACFAVGDYKTYPLWPQMYEFEVDYQPRELRNNWSMVVSNARKMEWI